jgi:hypothetical protein
VAAAFKISCGALIRTGFPGRNNARSGREEG